MSSGPCDLPTPVQHCAPVTAEVRTPDATNPNDKVIVDGADSGQQLQTAIFPLAQKLNPSDLKKTVRICPESSAAKWIHAYNINSTLKGPRPEN